MEILLGGISALFYGVADFLGGEGAKRAPAASVVLWAGVISFPLLTALALMVGGEPVLGDFILGALAGVFGAFGLVALFAGLGLGRAAAVAPVSAALAAVIPVLVGVIDGERPSSLAWAGIAVGIPAIMLCSSVADTGGVKAGGLFYGVAAGVGFGTFTALIRFTAPESNLLPLIASRGATMVLIIGIGVFGIWKVVGFGQVPKGSVATNGILDVTANVTLLLALRAGSLALAAVAAAFYPAVTVLMARVINAEHLRKRQIVGLVLTLGALAAIALG